MRNVSRSAGDRGYPIVTCRNIRRVKALNKYFCTVASRRSIRAIGQRRDIPFGDTLERSPKVSLSAK